VHYHLQEAEIGRIVVPGQSEQKKVCKAPSQQKKDGPGSTCQASLRKQVCKNPSQWEKLGVVVYACHPRHAWAKSETLSPKQSHHKELEAKLKQYSTCLASIKP
jgi:hypothetical protein